MMKDLLKRILPNFIIYIIKFILHPIYFLRIIHERVENIYIQPIRYRKLVKNLRSKERIRVAFFLVDESVWKYDGLYRMMEKHPSFEPIVVICPRVNLGMEFMLKTLKDAYSFAQTQGYHTVLGYDKATQTYLNVREQIQPDIICYTNPYRGLIHPDFFIDKFKDILTCYVSYYYCEVSNFRDFIDITLPNTVWKFFLETPYHMEMAKRNMYNKGKNTVLTGYPGIDSFVDLDYQPKDVWKVTSKPLKKIIWAPHHSIGANELIHYSCFLECCDFMIGLAEKYKNQIQIAFKPHPLLRPKLEQIWGKEKTDDYFQKWEDMPNTQFENGSYQDLFLTSDAMIHDSGSFLIEYLYTHRPVLRTILNDDYKKELNDFAIECMDYYYKANKNSEIEAFVQMVIANEDSLKERRESFYQKKLLPPYGKLPSVNIFNDLLKELGK